MTFDRDELMQHAYDEEMERLEVERLIEDARAEARRDYERMQGERRARA